MEHRPRLPPGQHPVEHLPILHVGSVPAFDPATWDLRIEGEARTPRPLTYQELRALPSVIAISDFHCVEGWSRLDCAWEGLRFSDLCDLVLPTERARFVTIGCDGGPSTGSGSPPASQQGPPRAQPRGGYTTSLPLDDLLQPDVLLAWGLDAGPLPPEHGFPLRLIVPHKYAYKSAKWVRWLCFTFDQEIGYWEARGYSNTADPWREERRA